jgi:hypothetical protein
MDPITLEVLKRQGKLNEFGMVPNDFDMNLNGLSLRSFDRLELIEETCEDCDIVKSSDLASIANKILIVITEC